MISEIGIISSPELFQANIDFELKKIESINALE
jgi:hypothetical protein